MPYPQEIAGRSVLLLSRIDFPLDIGSLLQQSVVVVSETVFVRFDRSNVDPALYIRWGQVAGSRISVTKFRASMVRIDSGFSVREPLRRAAFAVLSEIRQSSD